MGRIISVANQKGGVGKTATTVQTAYRLNDLGYRVLVVDLDTQGNATSELGVDKIQYGNNIIKLLSHEKFEVCNIRENFDVIASNIKLAAFERTYNSFMNRELRLRRALEKLKDNYDFIVIDCAPSLNDITLAGITAADDLIVPIKMGKGALEGFSDLILTFKNIKQECNPDINGPYVLFTLYRPVVKSFEPLYDQVTNQFGSDVFETRIRNSVELEKSSLYEKSIFEYNKSSSVAEDYTMFVDEYLKKINKGE